MTRSISVSRASTRSSAPPIHGVAVCRAERFSLPV
jgi:hypothetical protein